MNQGLTWAGVRWAFTTDYDTNWFPLTWLSHMVDCQLFTLNRPGEHHQTNVLLHVLNALLLYAVLVHMTTAVWRSALVAELFALHPLHVESVAWVAERKDVLSTFFGLLSIWTYVQYTRRGRVGWYLSVAVFLAISLMAKPMLVTLPLVFLLLDYWPLKRARRLGGLVMEKLPLLGVCAISCVVTYSVQRGGTGYQLAQQVNVPLRTANALVSFVRYLGKTIWPADLAVMYPHPNMGGGVAWQWWQIAGAAVILSAITIAVVFATISGRRYFAVGWLWFLGTLVPVIGLVQVGHQAMADRYTYVPLIGIFMITAWGLDQLADRFGWRVRAATALGAVVVLVACAAVSFEQTKSWRNTQTLYVRALAVEPRNPFVRVNYGTYLLDEKRDIAAAKQQYLLARQSDPTDPLVHANLGLVAQKQYRFDDAIDHYRQAVRLSPTDARWRQALANVLRATGQFDEAQTHEREAQRRRGTGSGP